MKWQPIALCVVFCSGVAHADSSLSTSPVIATFDHFIGTKPVASPEPSELDAAIWSFDPAVPRGTLSFRSTDVIKADKIKTLAPGFYAIHGDHGAALALRPGPAGIEARMRVSLASVETPQELVVSYRASIPLVDPTSTHARGDGRPTEMARVEFSWSADGEHFTPVRDGDATFMTDDNIVQIAPVITLGLKDAPNEVVLRWRIPHDEMSLIVIDDIAVRTKPERALVIVHVEAAADEKSFMKESLRHALAARGMTIVTCEEDIDEEANTIQQLGKLGVRRRDDAPSRIDILQSMTRVGCHAPPGAELWTAWLTAHSDARNGSREVSLRLKNLNEAAPEPSIALVAEPQGGHWSWSAMIDKVAQRIMQEADHPSISIPPKARFDIRSKLALRPHVTTTSEKPEWALYRCLDQEACDRFYRDTIDYSECLRQRLTWPSWEASAPPQCLERGYDWGIDDVSTDKDVLLLRDSVRINVPGNYVLVATIHDGAELVKAAELVKVDELSHQFVIGVGAGVNPGTFATTGTYGYLLGELGNFFDFRAGGTFVNSVEGLEQADGFIGPALLVDLRFHKLIFSEALSAGVLAHRDGDTLTTRLGVDGVMTLTWMPIPGRGLGAGVAMFGVYNTKSPEIVPMLASTFAW